MARELKLIFLITSATLSTHVIASTLAGTPETTTPLQLTRGTNRSLKTLTDGISADTGSEDPTNDQDLFATIVDVPSKLQQPDYYTQPQISKLEAKERVEPGYCRRVKDFVVGRHGYGSIKFFGETDVRKLDLETLIQFNNREVVVYMDESKKPPVVCGWIKDR
nr:nuclear pore complex protein NUP98A isoform X1 [Tanacetum cinerariifolium]